MKTFKDTEGREWNIAATIGSLRRVKDLAEVDLTDPRSIASLGDDPFTFGSVLYALCKPQIDARNLTEEQFAAAFDGDVCDAAASAVVEELISFSRPAKRQTLRRVMEKKQALGRTLTEAAERMIADGGEVDRAVAMRIAEMNRSISGTPLTSLPESSASIPPA